jgi:competence protein ComEC
LLKKTSLLKFDSKTSGVVKLYKYFLSITLAGIFATLATSPFIMFHFKNFSTYSVITNLLAIPLTEFIIMPFGILGMMLILWSWV